MVQGDIFSLKFFPKSTTEQFIKLRSAGRSLRYITKKIGVSRTVLIRWHREHKQQIDSQGLAKDLGDGEVRENLVLSLIARTMGEIDRRGGLEGATDKDLYGMLFSGLRAHKQLTTGKDGDVEPGDPGIGQIYRELGLGEDKRKK